MNKIGVVLVFVIQKLVRKTDQAAAKVIKKSLRANENSRAAPRGWTGGSPTCACILIVGVLLFPARGCVASSLLSLKTRTRKQMISFFVETTGHRALKVGIKFRKFMAE